MNIIYNLRSELAMSSFFLQTAEASGETGNAQTDCQRGTSSLEFLLVFSGIIYRCFMPVCGIVKTITPRCHG